MTVPLYLAPDILLVNQSIIKIDECIFTIFMNTDLHKPDKNVYKQQSVYLS